MTDIQQPAQAPQQLPVIPIRDGVVFPGTEVVLTFGRKKSIIAIEKAEATNKQIVLLMQKTSDANDPGPSDLYTIGSVVEIVRMFRNEEEINALVRGISRVEVLSYESLDPYFEAFVAQIPDTIIQNDEVKALCNTIVGQLRRAINLGKAVDFLVFMNIMSGTSAIDLSNHVANVIEIKPHEKQALLEISDVKMRLERISQYLNHEVKVLELERKIVSKTNERFDKNMRENVLRERLKTIEKELGEDSENKENKELADKIKAANMPESVKEKADKELKRLNQMSQYNPEASYLRTYLDWLVELPWSVASNSHDVDITAAEKVLNEDHYGLKKVKERIVEYLAVMKLKKSLQHAADEDQLPPSVQIPTAGTPASTKSSVEEKPKKRSANAPTILCFVGPPGVGKTSLGKSIARSLGRKFVRMSLGGIRDEAEIRGHRRTYVGALPGRIIQGIKQAGTNNPVFMLDEIDKVGTDFRGDPSAALLEALDPEQNFEFSDHYLEVPFDLSDVFFITTCNILETIPPALRDRLEIIHFPGYTADEKFNIAKNFITKKQKENHGLQPDQLQLTDGALKTIIDKYTREAGVRNLEREIAKVCRKTAKAVASGKTGTISVIPTNIHEYLGPARFLSSIIDKKDEVGVTTGLAWTEAGGDILFIEVALMPGRGNLIVTGRLGEVMKESCQAAMSYIRSRWSVLGLPEKFYQKIDIHIHVPEGAVPKDGPSAGIAITTALASALTNIPTDRFVGMTGEVTLRGKVLEIGGVKEKVIAAHRAKLRTVILPKNNKKDLEDIPPYVLKDLTFKFVEHMDEVLGIALKKHLPKAKNLKRKQETTRQPLIAQLHS